MPMTLILNSAAAAKIGSNPKVRYDIKDGQLLLRPTDRKQGTHLVTVTPKGKGVQLVLGSEQPVLQEGEKRRGRKRTHPLMSVDDPSYGLKLDLGQELMLEEDKYGWLKLVPMPEGTSAKDAPARAKVEPNKVAKGKAK